VALFETFGRAPPEIVEHLRTYQPGWKAYFQLAQTPGVFSELDEWIRLGCARCRWCKERFARLVVGLPALMAQHKRLPAVLA